MKKVDTSAISTTAGLPGKSGVLNHILQSFADIFAALTQFIAGSPFYNANITYILFGCVDSGAGLAHVISAGWVMYNGEFYQVDAASFVCPAGQVVVGNIVTTYATGAAGDPVGFTDGSSRNVLQIRKIVLSSGLTGTGSPSGVDFILWQRSASPSLSKALFATYGVTQTVTFQMDQSIFFTTGPASGAYSLNFDLTGAVPGTVCTMKITAAGGSTGTINTPAGANVINLGGALTASKTNYITIEYAGVNEAGNNELRYSVISL